MEPTPEQIEQFIEANPEGISDKQMSAFLDGNFEAKADSESSVKPPDAGEPGAPTEKTKPAENGEPEKEEDDELSVLTKDGKHHMPFKVVEDMRAERAELLVELKSARESSLALQQFISQQLSSSQLQAAQAKDEQTGTTEATDEYLSDLELEFPGTKEALQKLISPLVKELSDIKAERQAERETIAQAEARADAQAALDSAVAQVHEDYYELTDPKNNEFWKWFASTPSYISVPPKDGYDSQTVIDIIKLYKAEHPPAAGSDTPGKPDTAKSQEDTRQKIAEAIKKAESKSGVRSLSDIPGSVTPGLDEVEALSTMDAMTMAQKFEGKTPEEIQDLTARLMRIL